MQSTATSNRRLADDEVGELARVFMHDHAF
jgi:hypothetical protein